MKEKTYIRKTFWCQFIVLLNKWGRQLFRYFSLSSQGSHQPYCHVVLLKERIKLIYKNAVSLWTGFQKPNIIFFVVVHTFKNILEEHLLWVLMQTGLQENQSIKQIAQTPVCLNRCKKHKLPWSHLVSQILCTLMCHLCIVLLSICSDTFAKVNTSHGKFNRCPKSEEEVLIIFPPET